MVDILLDGSQGEGGGQVLRTAVSLSAITGKSFRIENIRGSRSKPGLLRQHLTAVRAAAEVCGASVTGAELRSGTLTFHPGPIQAGDYHFAIGSAGSTTLVAQTVLPLLLCAKEPSRVVFEGGTHNPKAPTYGFLASAFLPALREMGHAVTSELESYGFYPAGGGRFALDVRPSHNPNRLDWLEAGPARELTVETITSRLPRHIPQRELQTIKEGLKQVSLPEDCRVGLLERQASSRSAGNVILITLRRNQTEIVSEVGEVGRRAEDVATEALKVVSELIRTQVPVGEHLADQLMLPLAIGAGGRYRTLALSLHSTTNLEIIRRFLDVGIETVQDTETKCVEVRIRT